MKRLFAFCMTLILLTTCVNAYDTSDWAREDVAKAFDLKIILHSQSDSDLRLSIGRGNFAEKAASLVAIEFGSSLESYLIIMGYRTQAATNDTINLTAQDVAVSLGILQGRGDGDLDTTSAITRQEAAVMLARTYRSYHSDIPDTLTPLSFSDQGDIADWALDDVRLMNHLGIMTGVDDARFDPLGTYTGEQCMVTLLRLHEKTPYNGSIAQNPFEIPKLKDGFSKNWNRGSWPFAIETDEYYIVCRGYCGALASDWYYIDIIGRDMSRRTYHTLIFTADNYYRGKNYVWPTNAFVSADGTQLFYSAAVDQDVYYTNEEGVPDATPTMFKGIYTVTMDLKTGEQTYTRSS